MGFAVSHTKCFVVAKVVVNAEGIKRLACSLGCTIYHNQSPIAESDRR